MVGTHSEAVTSDGNGRGNEVTCEPGFASRAENRLSTRDVPLALSLSPCKRFASVRKARSKQHLGTDDQYLESCPALSPLIVRDTNTA